MWNLVSVYISSNCNTPLVQLDKIPGANPRAVEVTTILVVNFLKMLVKLSVIRSGTNQQ